MKKFIFSLLFFCLFIPLKAQEWNVIDASGFRQGAWKITAALKKLGPPWAPDQIVSEGSYVHSREQGVWISYYQTGVKLSSVTYNMGLKDGLCEFFNRQGTIVSSTEYTKGIWNGTRKDYYPDGTLLMESRWHYGEMIGDVKTYYPSGKLYEEGTWANGWFIGDYKIYNENGTLKREALPPITQ